MKHLTRKEDPTGFLNLFRHEASMRFGDPSGLIYSRGKWHHECKRGPGRRHVRGVNGASLNGSKHLHSSPTPRGW